MRPNKLLEFPGTFVYPVGADPGPHGNPKSTMSDTKTKPKSAKADSGSAAKSKSDKSTSESKTASDASDKSTSDTSKSDKSTSDKSKSDSGSGSAEKSARESIGGSKEVHYGYFSNVKTPEYRSGWDAIWGNDKGPSKKKSAAKKSTTASRKPLTPVRLNLDIDELPADLRDGLAKVARAKLKKSRVNYDKRDAAGAVEWQIECWVKRA